MWHSTDIRSALFTRISNQSTNDGKLSFLTSGLVTKLASM